MTPSVESGGKDKHEQLGNLIIQMESIKKNQKEMLEIKNKYQNLVDTGYWVKLSLVLCKGNFCTSL